MVFCLLHILTSVWETVCMCAGFNRDTVFPSTAEQSQPNLTLFKTLVMHCTHIPSVTCFEEPAPGSDCTALAMPSIIGRPLLLLSANSSATV
jgi:hypothetical protein